MNKWHEGGTNAFYADADGKVLGRVRKGLDTHYAESGNRELGEFITTEAARAAVERFFSPERALQNVLSATSSFK